jgi:hypothetical protein
VSGFNRSAELGRDHATETSEDDAELDDIEEHLTWCSQCIDAAENPAGGNDPAGIIAGTFDD